MDVKTIMRTNGIRKNDKNVGNLSEIEASRVALALVTEVSKQGRKQVS